MSKGKSEHQKPAKNTKELEDKFVAVIWLAVELRRIANYIGDQEPVTIDLINERTKEELVDDLRGTLNCIEDARQRATKIRDEYSGQFREMAKQASIILVKTSIPIAHALNRIYSIDLRKHPDSLFKYFWGAYKRANENCQELEVLSSELEVEAKEHFTKRKPQQQPKMKLQTKREEPLTIKVAKEVRKLPDASSEQIAKIVGTTSGSVRNTTAWKNRKNLRQKPNKPRRGSKNEEGSMESYAGGPQAEHYDIFQMFQDYESGKTTEYPTPERIAEKLTTKDNIISKQHAKDLLEEARSLLNFD